MKKLMLGLMMAFAVTAEAEEVPLALIGDLRYSLDTEAKTATITGYNQFGNPPTTVDVSEVEWEEQKYTVTSVRGSAFFECGSLTSVYLPNATTIGDGAFDSCGSLTSVSLPNATTIGESAFYGCGLTSVYLPNATTIEIGAFGFCPKLTSVSLPNATTIGKFAFSACSELKKIYVNETMKETLRSDRSLYGINEDCKILSDKVVVEPHPVEHSTATIYTNGVEVTDSPIEVLLNATVEVVFTAEWGYRFEDYTTVQTNTVIATDDPTKVDGPEAIRNLVVIEPYPAEHSTVKVYTDGAEVTSNLIEVVSNATVEVVFTAEWGYCFEDDHSTVQTNTVTATDNPTEVDGPVVVKIPSLSEDETQQAKYEVKEAEVETNVQLTVSSEVKVLPSVTLKSGDTVLNQTDYEYACEFYGIPKQTEPSVPDVPAKPTADDFKAVSKDAQVIGSDEIAVKKESIAAPSAGTVMVEDNKVQLGVTVLKTSDLTAETKTWDKVKVTKDDIDVDEDGNIIVNVPVDSASGFMILQSKDAKVEPSDDLR